MRTAKKIFRITRNARFQPQHRRNEANGRGHLGIIGKHISQPLHSRCLPFPPKRNKHAKKKITEARRTAFRSCNWLPVVMCIRVLRNWLPHPLPLATASAASVAHSFFASSVAVPRFRYRRVFLSLKVVPISFVSLGFVEA